MQKLPLEDLLSKVDSIYKLVILASRRAIELSEGAARLTDARTEDRPAKTALKEIQEGKIAYKVKEKK